MLLSTRRDPPTGLKLPRSRQTSTFKQILLSSPLPSPALPAILPRHGKKPPQLNSRRMLRFIGWIGISAIVWTVLRQIFLPMVTERAGANDHALESVSNLVAAETLPDFASPIAFTGKDGRPRWTVLIPGEHNGPLDGSQYADICADAPEIANHVAQSRGARRLRTELRYVDKDPNYLDSSQARAQGLLPGVKSPDESESGLPICASSLTYVLDATFAGYGKTLLGMWTAYGLAQKEKRTFFIDDSQFTYGKLSTFFTSSTKKATCQPPAWADRTPCPRSARHLVIGPSTFEYAFDKTFHDHFGTKQIFKMARVGYEALFNLRDDDATFVQARISELRKSIDKDASDFLVGVHMRRGDRHPFEFQYQHGYLPPSKYLSRALQSTERQQHKPRGAKIVLASDDADIYSSPEVGGTIRAQERIRLATKKQLAAKVPDKKADNGLGWEGGFFSSQFWGIGVPESEKNRRSVYSPQPTGARLQSDVSLIHSQSHSQAILENEKGDMVEGDRDYRSAPTPEALQLREYIGRAYLLDLAVLAGSDEIVCGVSSAACRILGVMMGWTSLQRGKWINVDGEYGWSVFT